jgi:hypothetical protein
MTTASLGAGNVTITLDGEEVVLRPSLKAAQTISKQSGGIIAAVQAVGGFDFETIVSVIALGLGVSQGREVQALAEKVYATGLTDLVEPVTRFLTIVANGGRPVEAGGEGQKDPQ